MSGSSAKKKRSMSKAKFDAIMAEAHIDLERRLEARWQQYRDAGYADREIAQMSLAHFKRGELAAKYPVLLRELEMKLHRMDPEHFPLTQ